MIATEMAKRRHIVIVDDNAVNLELAENALKNYYKLTKLISGEQLLKLLTRIKPDLILLDVQMPGMSGYEVMKIISENEDYNKIPVIFLTAQDSFSSEKEGFRLGAKDFIRKPFDNDVMLARINTQIELYLYRTHLEELVETKSKQLADLQHVLTISCAEMIESRDGTTGAHVRNTTMYYDIITNAILNDSYLHDIDSPGIIEDLLKASTLHDIGKIGISDMILKKPASLDKSEFEEMKKHSQIGADMIEKIVSQTYFERYLNYAKDMALYHHERWDGSGYPCGLKGEQIPLYVRILSIVDVYDALTSVRPYKRAFLHEEALEIMRADAGKFFDPKIFKLFLENEKLVANIVKE